MSDFTSRVASRQRRSLLAKSTNRPLSRGRSLACLTLREATTSCWRSRRFSANSSSLERKASSMRPETRGSGRRASVTVPLAHAASLPATARALAFTTASDTHPISPTSGRIPSPCVSQFLQSFSGETYWEPSQALLHSQRPEPPLHPALRRPLVLMRGRTPLLMPGRTLDLDTIPLGSPPP